MIFCKTKIRLAGILLFGLSITGLQAQDAIITSGGNGSGISGTVSYSVGQIVYTTHSNSISNVSQGVQQPYEISVVTAVEQAKDISLQIVVNPNPTQDFLTLKIENQEEQNLSFGLYNINGSLLRYNKIVANETDIEMKTYSSGIYFMKVTDNNKEIKTSKIIKN